MAVAAAAAAARAAAAAARPLGEDELGRPVGVMLSETETFVLLEMPGRVVD